MTDQRISTEEVEGIASRVEKWFPYSAHAIRSLAAERDALREENGRLRGRGIGKIADEAFAQGFKRGYAAGSGENQP